MFLPCRQQNFNFHYSKLVKFQESGPSNPPNNPKKIELPETYRERDFRISKERQEKEAINKGEKMANTAKGKINENELIQKTLMKASGKIYLPDTKEAEFLYGKEEKQSKEKVKKPKIILPP